MRLSLSCVATLSLAGLSLVTPVAGEAFERLAAVPDGWRYDGTPDGNQPIRLRIALRQPNVDKFEEALIDMSTPGHARYGRHFTSYREMKELLLPEPDSVSSVRSWLRSSGVADLDEDADWINFRTTVSKANRLLDAHFLWYTNADDNDNNDKEVRILRTLQYSVPPTVSLHINMIQPTTRFGQLRANRATIRHRTPITPQSHLRVMNTFDPNSTAHCDTAITPVCLHDLYRTAGYTADPKHGSKIGFASYLEEYARYTDLAQFAQRFAPNAVGYNFSVVTFNGGLNDQDSPADSGEANLDLQYIVALSAPLPVTEFSTGGRGPMIPDLSQPDPNDNTNEPYLEFLQGVLKLNQEDLPQVISTSYGEDEQTIPESYARTVCNLFGQLGSRGVSILFASGDSGVGAACQTNDAEKKTHFPPQFPASCPWVTAVGGTNGTSPEQGVYFSSGGFSDYFPRPMYQETAVETYLAELGDTWSEYFNRSGRAFPDVAAQASKFAVIDKGRLGLFDGTSCSAPVFSGVVALLNDVRLKAGMPVLGFLNPWLYSVGVRGLNDIVHGGSVGCDGRSRFGGTLNGSPVIPYASWNATAGWDPVTGLGTPDFERLREIALRV